ncbi:MAG: c-type cytochrome, partial [Planctomycetaceae bacterium]|nr:c-type cytochrome [Planctomycetaceae bacterium]
FGWRSGTGKWPVYYADSLPPMVNIGPGSPVGVEFGYGLKFPAKYQQALFICDWTFGTMYAIHLQPDRSSYSAVKEEFVARTPLPLTDVAAGPDGALYFTIGGRGTQSELFRVTYAGEESTAPVEYRNSAFAAERNHRRDLEKWLGYGATRNFELPAESNDFLKTALADIASGDRFLRTASRNAFFNSLILWEGLTADAIRNADLSETTPDGLFAIAIAFARAPFAQVIAKHNQPAAEVDSWKKNAQTVLVSSFARRSFQSLTVDQKIDYLRALSLVFLRLGEPTETQQAELLKQLDGQFPTDNDHVNHELCQMLVYLNSPTIVEKTVALLQQPSQPTVNEDMQELLARNRGYGGAIANMIANAPDQQQIWYAFCLRTAKVGWTMENRKGYFGWFERAATWAGGNSFRKFLQNIDDETFLNASENERILIEASGARKPYKAPELPKPTGPGQEWTLDQVRMLASDGLKNRNFENGQKMFAATRCIVCHRFAGDGGATGPDLTQLAGRFNLEALTEALMDPSKVISDQYKGSTVLTKEGATFTGRIVSETDKQISVLTDPEDSTKVVDLAKDQIDEIVPSTTSLMPAGLLKPLNQDEVLDLLAYLLSRGDKGNPMFRR